MLQQTITQEIKDYLALHPTHKLVTITNQWASETGKRMALTPEQIRDWKHFYEIQDAAIDYQETAHIEYAADRGNLSEPYGVVHHEISYAIHNPDRAHLIVEDVQPHEAPFIPDVDPTWDKNRRDHSERKHGKPNGSQESLCDFTQHPKTWSDDETTV
jgi:hypothetical protein